MEVSRPRRILAVSQPESGLLELVKELTGSTPSLASETVAGTTHDWAVKTNYYTATIPIWLDEISDSATWSADFLAPEAREVLMALGAFIVCFRKPINGDELKKIKSLLESVGEVVREGCGLSWDGVCLAVAMPQSTTPHLEKAFDEWDDMCQQFGFEFVDFESKGRNEYAEPMGIERLKEALEANEWETADELDDDINLDDFNEESDDERGLDFGIPRSEMTEEMAGMKRAIYGQTMPGDDENEEDAPQDDEVEKLQAMMLKMQAVRDMGADMPEAERKKFAAKAVSEIMKQL